MKYKLLLWTCMLSSQMLGQTTPRDTEPKIFSVDQPGSQSIPLPASIRTLLEHDPDVADTMASRSPALTNIYVLARIDSRTPG